MHLCSLMVLLLAKFLELICRDFCVYLMMLYDGFNDVLYQIMVYVDVITI